MASDTVPPAIDGGEVLDGSWTTLSSNPSTDPVSTETSSRSDSDNGSNHHHGDGTNQNYLELPEKDPVVEKSSGDSSPKSATSWEDAYIHGYREGFTKAHIELKHQPIAIIGMSCRLPGSVSTPEEFWELLARSRSGFSSIPPTRFSANRFVHPNPGKSGTTNAQGGNFLTQDLKAFDAPFFGFTQQEAISLDPQQRLLLECTFEALENAGVPKHSVVGKNVGVFIGGSLSEYEVDHYRDPETIPMHQATGCAMAMQSNRISHFFDFRGPSFTVDTACSSSLVALHTACKSLRYGESSLAIAAGVHLNMSPECWISYSMSRLFSDAGRSFAFDNRGTGYGRGEGCGIILLKPLDQALKDNDPIRAVITGSGINQDGRTPGITMPNAFAQEALIRSIYSEGGMDPRDTGYVEAHGTGTRVGDPIEVAALHKVFGEGRTKRKPLFLGSVKSNIGHLEAAAGIAGVIKTALMMERGFILPNHDFKHPNQSIPFDEWGLKVPIRQQPWPFGKRWASVNSFGFGGTNAHVVLTRGPLERKTMKEEIDIQPQERLFLLSGNDKVTAEKIMKNMCIYLEQRPEIFEHDLLSNLAYTLGQRKSFFPWRMAITASSSVELVELLSSGKIIPAKQEFEALRFGWVFTGQGAQWWAMGRELYEQYPVYAAALDRASAHLSSIGAHFCLREELQKDERTTQVNAAHISQPACTAVQLALIELLVSWNVTPTSVAGHSSGEIAAAYSAGIITFEDAMTIAYHRGRLIPTLKERYPDLDGCMLAVGAGVAEIKPLLERVPLDLGEARIACINSPSSVTVSGDTKAVIELQAMIEASYPGTFARRLAVDTAYHSHHMNLVAKEYTQALRSLQPPRVTDVRFHSSLLGRLASYADLDATYWVQNLTCAVRFDDAVQSMCAPYEDYKIGTNHLIEIGPHAALQGPLKQTLKYIGGPATKITYTSVLSRKKNAVKTALDFAGNLFVKGCMLDMGRINFAKPMDRSPQVLTDMPRYAWNHATTYFHESRMTNVHKFHDAPRNDLIGVLTPHSDDIEPIWRSVLRLDDIPWLRHHQIQGVTIFPISCYAVMAIESMAQHQKSRQRQFDSLQVLDLAVKSPLMLTEEDAELTTKLVSDVGHQQDSHFGFSIRSWSASKGWVEHCTGSVRAYLNTEINQVDGMRAEANRKREVQDWVSEVDREVDHPVLASNLYRDLAAIGVVYGESFQGLEECHVSDRAARVKVKVNDTAAEMPNHFESEYILHPSVLEQLITSYWPIASASGPPETVHLPSSIGLITVSLANIGQLRTPGCSAQAFCGATTPISDIRSNKLDMVALDESSEPIVSIQDLLITPIIELDQDDNVSGPRELCYKMEWETVDAEPESITEGPQPWADAEIVILHGDSQSQRLLASNLSDQLQHLTGRTPVAGSLESLAEQATDKLCLCISELEEPLLTSLDPSQFALLQGLLTRIRGILWTVKGAYMDSQNPNSNMVMGLSRTLRSEGTLMNFITLDLDGDRLRDDPQIAQVILKVLSLSFKVDRTFEETEYMERGGQLFTPRIVHDSALNEYVDAQLHPSATEPANFLDTQRPLRGDLVRPNAFDSFIITDHKLPELPEDEVELQVKAIGLNHADTRQDAAIGIECSGIITQVGSRVPNLRPGDRVASLTPRGALSTVARAHYPFLFKLSDNCTFETAATLPLAYCTASYALIDQARLQEGDAILIHDAASGVGQACLSIALTIGADPWTTVSNAAEKALLMENFCIPEHRIYYSGRTDFVKGIRKDTQGSGVSIVLDCLTDPTISQASCEILAPFGRLIRLGSTQVACAMKLAKNVSLIYVDMVELLDHRPRTVHRLLADVARLHKLGNITSLQNVKSYGISEVAAALQALHIEGPRGKAVIIPQENELVMAPRTENQTALLCQDATYVLIGGTGGLGRSMARWMISKGAKNLVLLSRSGTVQGAAKEQIDALNNAGANIRVYSCDVVDKAAVEKLIHEDLTHLPPVRGVIHGAMVLYDVLFEKMTYDEYSSVIASKTHGAWNFHNALASRQDPSLDFFIAISSAAGAVGNRGQAAYAAANTFLNGFAQYLRSRGIPSASLDLTAVSDAGYLAADAAKAAEVARNLGSDTICEAEVLALLQAAIEGKLESCNGHPITGMRITPTMRPFWSQDAKFVHLLRAAEAASTDSATAVKVSWSAAFRNAGSRTEAEQVVCSALVEKIAEVISMEKEELDTGRALSHYPLDSLTAIEVRNFITRMFEASLQVLELLASGSIESLAKVVCTKTKITMPEA